MLDKYQAGGGDVAASSKWKGAQNLTYKEAYPSCYCMKLLTAHTTKGKWYLFSQGMETDRVGLDFFGQRIILLEER